jgi:hypothetical protein
VFVFPFVEWCSTSATEVIAQTRFGWSNMLGVLREMQLSSFLAKRQLRFEMKKNEGGRGEGISSAGTPLS